MKILIITGTPKEEGLACSCVDAALRGAESVGADVEVVRVCKTKIGPCRICGEGWGTCREAHRCAFGTDGFDELQAKVHDCDGLILQTPVYWGEMTEHLKSFIDRLRRCEAIGNESGLEGKPVLLIASPGGSGNGGLSCLEQMERFARNVRARVFDYVIVNRWNREYKLAAVEAAAKAMSKG